MIKPITFKIDRWVSFDTIHFEQDNVAQVYFDFFTNLKHKRYETLQRREKPYF